VRRVCGVLRQDKDNDSGRVDGVHDVSGIKLAGRHVPRRDPAIHTRAFQRSTNGVGNGTIRRGVAYEYRVGAGRAEHGSRRRKRGIRCLFSVAAFGHVGYSHLPLGMVADTDRVSNQRAL
jgi:hypothetical protein